MNLKRKLPFLFSLLLCSCGGGTSVITTSHQPVVPPANDKDVNVIVLAGQSNAEGFTFMNNMEKFCTENDKSYDEYAIGYEDVKITLHERFYFSDVAGHYSNKEEPFKTHFINVKAGLGAGYDNIGPELGIAEYIHHNVKSDRPTYIIKFTSGGTGFSSNPSWNSPSSKVAVGDLYTKFTNYVTDGLNNLKGQGLNPKIRSFVWMQGEADGSSSSSAILYKNRLKAFFTDFRNTYSSYAEDNNGNNIHIIDGHIADSGTWPQHVVINSSKDELAAELENYQTVDTNSTGLNLLLNNDGYGGGDNAHYTLDSVVKLGNEFGKRIVESNCLKYNEGTYSDNVKDFSVDDGIKRDNVIRLEAEKSIIKNGCNIVTESTTEASGNGCVGYFWESKAPSIKFVVESDKDEENALITVSLASTVQQKRRELDHPLYKTDMVTVNGESVRINGVLPARKGNNWYNFSEHSGFANLKKGTNVIELHYDYNMSYCIEEFRVNVDYIDVKTASAKLSSTNTNIVEAEVCELQTAEIGKIITNSPSNNGYVHKLTKGATITGKFEASINSLASIHAGFGLNSRAKLSEFIKVEINNNEVNVNDEVIKGYHFERGQKTDWCEYMLAEGNVVAGENTFKVTLIKDGLDVVVDYFRICSTSKITVEPIIVNGGYKFEAEDSNHFTPYGTAKIAAEANSNNPSGGKYIGGLSKTVSGFKFKFNAEKDTTITLKVCVGLVVELDFGKVFDIYLTNSSVERQHLSSLDASLPEASAHQWFEWTLVTLGKVEVKQGENIIEFDHPDKNEYGVNVDYILIEADCLIS